MYKLSGGFLHHMTTPTYDSCLLTFSALWFNFYFYRFLLDDRQLDYGVDLQLQVCLDSSVQCDRYIQILENSLLPKQTCTYPRIFDDNSMY